MTSGDRILQLLVITGLTNAFVLHHCVLDAISVLTGVALLCYVGTLALASAAQEWCQKHELR